MARNIEIKARIEDVGRTHQLVAGVADRGPETLQQTDTFFKVDSGRLKMREFGDGMAELIYYHRPNQTGPKESLYQRTPVSNANAMRRLLSKTLGIVGCVRKTRTVFWAGRTRIHLDDVQALGNFLELEVVLREQEQLNVGVREAEDLMARLGIEEDSLVPDAYLELLLRQ